MNIFMHQRESQTILQMNLWLSVQLMVVVLRKTFAVTKTTFINPIAPQSVPPLLPKEC
jgi:hypothetical protein